jgi:hypothetical protein
MSHQQPKNSKPSGMAKGGEGLNGIMYFHYS